MKQMNSSEAVLLSHPDLSSGDKRVGTALSFFGVPWRALTIADFLAEITGRHPIPANLRVFCSAEVFLRLIKDFERTLDGRELWKEHVHSVFVHSGDDLDTLQELTRLLTGDRRAAVSKIDPGAVDLSVSDHLDDFCGAMAGMRVTGSASCANGTLTFDSSHENAVDIISAGSGATFLKVEYRNVPVFLSTCKKIVDVDAELTTQNFDVREDFLSAVPIVLYIKWAFAQICWTAPETNACLIIDDPVLKPIYGFVNFHELVSLTKRHKFSTNIAFIPWNWRRSSPEVVRLFRENPESFSLSVHGCDHTRAEFGSSDRNRLHGKIKQAVERMAGHETRTGICHDRVMVFPQGVFSQAAMDALKHTDFIAAVNNDVISADPRPRAITISDVWDTAVMAYRNFPIFTRRYPWEGVENFAFDLLLGKPAIIVIHHDFCHDRCLHLVKFVQRLNALKIRLTWRSLGEVVRRSCRQRELSPGLVEVEMYATQLRLENQSGQRKWYLIRRRESEPSSIKEIRAGSRNVGWGSTDGRVAFEIELNPGEKTMISMGFHDLTGNGRHADTLSYRTKAMLRRCLCEIRDNYITPARFRLAGSC
jgi:hypothetical protein